MKFFKKCTPIPPKAHLNSKSAKKEKKTYSLSAVLVKENELVLNKFRKTDYIVYEKLTRILFPFSDSKSLQSLSKKYLHNYFLKFCAPFEGRRYLNFEYSAVNDAAD